MNSDGATYNFMLQILLIFDHFSAVCYFLTIAIWGGEFEFGLKSVGPVSDVLRPAGSTDWDLFDEASLGYSYW
jgi:hypothetical protein